MAIGIFGIMQLMGRRFFMIVMIYADSALLSSSILKICGPYSSFIRSQRPLLPLRRFISGENTPQKLLILCTFFVFSWFHLILQGSKA